MEDKESEKEKETNYETNQEAKVLEEENKSKDENNHEAMILEEETKKENSKRSIFSLEGGIKPFSLYTRRVINTKKIRDYLNEDSIHGLCGSHNLGNTCFMNSSIACLSNCTELTCYFLSGDYKKDINRENKLGMGGNLAEAWGELLYEYWVKHTRVGDPSEFKKIFGHKIKRFSGYNQQDSNEFIILFLDNLNEDLNLVSKKQYIELKEKGENETDAECSKRFWDNYLKRNDSIVTDLFCGQLKCTITCPECKLINITFDPFNTLNLNIPERIKSHHYTNEYLSKFVFFYVPKYCLRTPIKVVITDILKIATFKDCFRCLKLEENFKYHKKINKLIINKIKGKKSIQIFNQEESLTVEEYGDDEFFFCYDIIDEKEDINIPLYFKDKNGFSEFPRIIMASENSNLDDIRRKIYFNIRKLILSPLKKENEEIDSLSEELKEYMTNIGVQDDYIFGLINQEYKDIFNPDPSKENNDYNRCIKNFIEDMPFKLYLTKDIDDYEEKKIYIIDEKNLFNVSQEFTELANIKTYKDSIKDFLNILKNEKYNIVLELKTNSKYINPKLYKLNNCVRNYCEFVEETKDEEKNDTITLKKCFDLFVTEEKLKKGNEWYCPKCKKHVLANKKMEIYYLPKILIISFKIFIKHNFYWEKNDELIYFPIENMDMKEYMVGPDKDNSKYDLFAVSQHYGGTGFGHYTAICKNFNKWYSYDDSSVYESKSENIISDAAYVLFYRRQTD